MGVATNADSFLMRLMITQAIPKRAKVSPKIKLPLYQMIQSQCFG